MLKSWKEFDMKKENRNIWQALALGLQFGFNMIVPILICTFFGIWLGDKTGQTWLVVLLFFVGALSGFTSIYKLSKNLLKDDPSDRRRNSGNAKKTK